MESAHTTDVAGRYERFARLEAKHHSDVYQDWAMAVSSDEQVCALLDLLPPDKRQPNLVFACARLHGAAPGPYASLRETLLGRWEAVRAEILTRSTQTNEPARLGILLPAFAQVARTAGAPLTLIELGASAGLCLTPDRWSYRWTDRDGHTVSELTTPGAIGTLSVSQRGPMAWTLPASLPPIAARIGLDLHPLDPADADTRRWLRTLVWPGQPEREQRLDAALDAAAERPIPVRQGDVTEPGTIDALLAEVPRDTVPVIFHTAVLAYLSAENRQRFVDDMSARVARGRCHWVSYEGHTAPDTLSAAAREHWGERLRRGAFTVCLDAEPVWQADGHARWVA